MIPFATRFGSWAVGLLFVFAAIQSSEGQVAPKSWARFFDGDPALLNQDYTSDRSETRWKPNGKRYQFKQWIRGYASCAKPIDDLLQAFGDYDRVFRDLDPKAADSAYRRILELSSGSGNPACKKALQRAYWVALIDLGPAKDPRFAVDYNHKNDLLLLTVFLVNQDIVDALTPELREKWAAGKASLWTEKKDGEYLLSGIYDCGESKIHLSSTLRPFNAAASLAHEIDHFYRDKIGFEYMKIWRERQDVREFIVSDELLSSLWGAFYQRHTYLLDRALGNARDYTSQGDEFNLFKPGGPLSFLMDATGLRPPIPFYEFYGLIDQRSQEPAIHKQLCAAEKTIRNGYFKKSRECSLETVFPSATWFNTESYLSQILDMRTDPAGWTELMEEFETLDRLTKEPSAVCKASAVAQKSGVLDDYIGKGLTKGEGGPQHPGNGGIKPGFVIRTCLKIKQ